MRRLLSAFLGARGPGLGTDSEATGGAEIGIFGYEVVYNRFWTGIINERAF